MVTGMEWRARAYADNGSVVLVVGVNTTTEYTGDLLWVHRVPQARTQSRKGFSVCDASELVTASDRHLDSQLKR